MNTEEGIKQVCAEIQALLLAKNQSYGDSALHPIRVFSKLDAEEGINIRMDDKLSRIKNSPDAFNEDPELDLIGYLILKRVNRRKKK